MVFLTASAPERIFLKNQRMKKGMKITQHAKSEGLTSKMPAKNSSENSVCFCPLLQILLTLFNKVKYRDPDYTVC